MKTLFGSSCNPKTAAPRRSRRGRCHESAFMRGNDYSRNLPPYAIRVQSKGVGIAICCVNRTAGRFQAARRLTRPSERAGSVWSAPASEQTGQSHCSLGARDRLSSLACIAAITVCLYPLSGHSSTQCSRLVLYGGPLLVDRGACFPLRRLHAHTIGRTSPSPPRPAKGLGGW